jgi:rfaE bifunctional protein kinase chain/domain
MNTEELFNSFSQKRVLVVGDVMVDAYLNGRVSRISPEAPVPIVNLTSSEDRLGGAANVALNLRSLGAEPILCSMVGSDAGGDSFVNLLEKRKLSTDGIIQSQSVKTTVKTRVLGNNQQLLRIDDERITPLNADQEAQMIQRVAELIADVDAVILEDYNKGLLTERVINEVIRLANENNVISTVDPKKDNFFAYREVTLFKPNLKELKEGLNIDFDFASDRTAFEQAIDELESRLSNKLSFVTLSEHGVFMKEKEAKHYITAHVRNIADVSGAGDTVIAVATLCLTAGLEPSLTAEIANLAGGLVCEQSGVVPIDQNALKTEIELLNR